MQFSIVVNDFARLFTTPLNLRVRIDKGSKFAGFQRVRRARRLRLTLQDVLKCAARHLFVIPPAPPPSLQTIDDWIAILSWHISTFWHVDPTTGSLFPKDQTVSPLQYFAWEHARYGGELLAEAVAVAMVDHYLRIGANRLYFYEEGNAARPDYVFYDARSGFIMRNGSKVGLESKLRGHDKFVYNNEQRVDFKKKKRGSVKSVLGVFLIHGRPYVQAKHLNKVSRTRVFVTDPPEQPAEPATEIELARAAVVHYLGVTGQLGLQGELRALSEMWADIRRNQLPTKITGPLMRPAVRVAGERFNGKHYTGRYISTLLRDEPDRDAMLRSLDAGRAGDILFYGVNDDVLDLIRRRDAIGLARYYDPNALRPSEASISGDGVMMWAKPADSTYAQMIRDSRQ